MKLLIVMPSGQLRGGAEEALLQYVSCRTSSDEPPLVVVLEEGPIVAALEERGCRVICLHAGQLRQGHLWLKTIQQIKSIIHKEKIDCILAWMTKGHLYSGPAARAARKPAFYFQHGLPDQGFVERMCQLIPAVGATSCSNFVAEEQRTKVKHPVIPVHMAADIARFAPVRQTSVAELKNKLGFDPARSLVGMVGRLQRWKGMHVFAEAFSTVRRNYPDLQGVIVGGPHTWEPDYEGFLTQRIRELGIENDLKMVGAQRNIPEWMQAMDVIVHASEREPFGIVIVEAMSLGKPVIASIPGGPAEIIEPDVSGQLVPSNHSAELASAIEKFLSNAEFASQCGKNAQQRAQQFSMEIFADNLDKALLQLA